MGPLCYLHIEHLSGARAIFYNICVLVGTEHDQISQSLGFIVYRKFCVAITKDTC
jgi:hypothetical protein